MNIVMLTDDYLPRIGGVAAHIYHLSRALTKLGCRVTILHCVNGKSGFSRHLIEEQAGGIPVQRLYIGKYRGRWHHVDILWALWQLKKHVGHIMLLHQHDYLYCSRAAMWFSKLAGCKWIWTNHTSMFVQSAAKGIFSSRARKIHSTMHGCIAVSREILELSAKLWKNANIVMEYIPNGVDTEMFSPKSHLLTQGCHKDGVPFIVLCPRRIAEKNGVIYFAKAAAILSSDHPNVDWRFWLTGHMHHASDYAETILENLTPVMLKGQVAFLGAVPHQLMPRVYGSSDVVVIPSLVEAVSLSALEAMACGVPVVASNVGGLPEVVKPLQTGMLVPPRDPEAIADAVWQLYCNPDLAACVASNAYAMVVEDYTWERIAERTVDFYQKVLS
jgi:glycosyltransferase involved in cell wall biosynthesis